MNDRNSFRSEKQRRRTIVWIGSAPFSIIVVAATLVLAHGRAHAAEPVIQGFPRALAVDATGNQYVEGVFAGSVDFDPSAGVDIKTSSGSFDIFVTRYNSNGSYAWTQTFGGSSDESSNNVGGIVVSGGTVYVTGAFSGTNAGIGGNGSLASSGGFDAFIMALDSASGAAKTTFGTNGLQKFGGTSDDVGTAITIGGNGLYVAGFLGSSDAGLGGLGTIGSTGTGGFILKLDAATATPILAFSGDGVQTLVGSEGLAGITVANGIVYLAGSFRTTIGIGGAGSVTSSGAADGFVAALDATTGAAVTTFSGDGIQTLGGTNEDGLRTPLVLGSTLYLSGNFWSTDATIGGTGTFSSQGFRDACVLALDAATGAAKTSFNGTGVQTFAGTNQDVGRWVVASGGVIYLVGNFFSSDAGIGGLGTVASIAGSDDVMIVALDASTGAPVTGFSGDGVQTFGGSAGEGGGFVSAATFGNTIFISSNFASTDAGVGGTGVRSPTVHSKQTLFPTRSPSGR